MATKVHIARLHELGFDRSRAVPFERVARIGCSQCEAVAINGHPAHEHGCPNRPWECRECGDVVPRGESCDCMAEC